MMPRTFGPPHRLGGGPNAVVSVVALGALLASVETSMIAKPEDCDIWSA